MRLISTSAFLGMLALTMTGCGLNNQQTVNPTPSTAPVVQTPPLVKPPLVVQNPNKAVSLAPGLIQPTNANQRAKLVAKGNRDPFAALFVPVLPPASAGIPIANSSASTQPAPTASSPTASGQSPRGQTSSRISTGQSTPKSVAINNPRTASTQSNSSNGTASSNSSRRTTANSSARSQSPQKGTSTTPSRRTPSGQTSPGVNAGQSGATSSNQNIPFPLPPTLPNTNLQPALPPPPQEPELAKNVVVTGIIQIGEQAQAIVQVPNEPTSRYVQVGQRLSNGQVLVKRIELNTGAEPLVVLEQYGVEVSKAVGEQAPSQGQQATPTSAVIQVPPQEDASLPTAELPGLFNAPVAASSVLQPSPNAPVAAR